jgi:hypothetical protein
VQIPHGPLDAHGIQLRGVPQLLPPQKTIVLLNVPYGYFAPGLGLGGNLAPKTHRAAEKKDKHPPA